VKLYPVEKTWAHHKTVSKYDTIKSEKHRPECLVEFGDFNFRVAQIVLALNIAVIARKIMIYISTKYL
jgi:hypothetical protein